ncbi:MAG: hypothetical protein IIB69_04950 [Proteobacteria bacterium]|nr:hypothetical protein [Pseudomonadota bacterium]
MSNKASDSKPIYIPEDQVPLPPPNADVITTCCDYCIVACGYKVYRWPADSPNGGPKKNQNALGLNYPLRHGQGGWVGPNQFTQANWKGKLHIQIRTPGLERNTLVEIRDILAGHKGSNQLVLHFIFPDGKKKIRTVESEMKVSPSDAVIEEVEAVLGEDCIRFE